MNFLYDFVKQNLLLKVDFYKVKIIPQFKIKNSALKKGFFWTILPGI